MPWFKRIQDDQSVADLSRRAQAGGRVECFGLSGSSTALMAASLARRHDGLVLLVVAHIDDADEVLDEMESLKVPTARFPAMEIVPGETSVNLELLAERLTLVQSLADGSGPALVVAPIAALMQQVPGVEELSGLHRRLQVGQTIDVEELLEWLADAGYQRVPTLDGAGEFAVRGGIVDIFSPGGIPVRLDLFGDEIEHINEIDLATMGSDRRVAYANVIGALTADQLVDRGASQLLFDQLPPDTVAVLDQMSELAEQGRSYLQRVANARGIVPLTEVLKAAEWRCRATVIHLHAVASPREEASSVRLPVAALPTFHENASEAVGELVQLAADHDTHVLCQNAAETQRIRELLGDFDGAPVVSVEEHYLHRGLVWTGGKGPPLALVPSHELLHRYHTRRRVGRLGQTRAVEAFLDLQPGDHVVHRDHGIARFIGLQALDRAGDGPAEEYLTLEFAGKAKLHVPASKIELVQPYIGAFGGTPQLSTLGGKRWTGQKQRVAEAVADLAEEMLQLQASRESMPGIRYPADTPWQQEFDAEFPYTETEDQLTAIAAVKRDMTDGRPMDRLLCGDVGFGKTEVAIRAAFKAVEYGKQAAVLVPTTWLAEQHDRTFRERFADYPFRIESLSRFKTGKQQRAILESLAKGQVDVVIGTHRLISQDVRFADLGLVIIDEEQRFGVEHKQRLLQLRATADVLTMTATPIPRTLHMSMLGLRDISSLTTAPLDRRSIVTEIISFDEQRIAHALSRELAREGQVFFVHNRVNDIEEVADQVQRLAPGARVLIGHGQMPVRQLESVMRRFVRGDADILVCTTIIESGIDMPTTNTMFVHNAHRFGLSELHQLRGRVGRYKHRAYCYLILDPDKVVSPVAMKRLRALESFSMLGAGFKIALRDLEIRGAGNLLGPQQSGHIAAVGYEMYCQLLEHAVARRKKQPLIHAVDTTVDLGITGTLPRGYIPSDARRMDAYRRTCQANQQEELDQVERDLQSAYGELPKSARRLLDLAEIRVAAAAIGVRTITRHEKDIIFRTDDPRSLEGPMSAAAGSLRLVGQPDGAGMTSVYYRPPANYLTEPDTLLAVLRKRLRDREPVAV